MIIKGVGIGRGVAVGPVIRMAQPLPEPSDAPRAEGIAAESEIARVEKSLALVNADLNRRAEEAANGDEGAKQAAPILQAVAMFASDPSLAESIKGLIQQGKTAERAVLEGFAAVEDMFRAIGGYQAERAADLHDVGQRVIADLMGAPAPGLPQSETPFVLVAEDLSPADTAALDMSKTLAIVTSQGGPTSHTAILARARGIVAVVSAAEAENLTDGTTVVVNAAKGELVVDPTEEEIAVAEAAKSRAAAAKELRGNPGSTKDGHLIPLLANVGKPADAAKALEYGAEGVGLFRTEFLFIGNSEPPTVEEQTRAYTELLSQFPGKKVVIRMLDAGADKPLPFLTPEDEPNPALGLRGLRTLRAHMDVLEGQLKALAAADAATDANLWVMAPMVADQHEADYFVKLGKSFGLKFVGAMAEVPSIALMADKVADVADFVSIGTNDLTQYTLAADRTLGSVANYQTAWHPAVLRAIKMICDAGNAKGMPVGVCGEAAADPDLAVVLAGLGVNSLSMTPVALDDVRASLAEVTFEEAQARAEAALEQRLDVDLAAGGGQAQEIKVVDVDVAVLVREAVLRVEDVHLVELLGTFAAVTQHHAHSGVAVDVGVLALEIVVLGVLEGEVADGGHEPGVHFPDLGPLVAVQDVRLGGAGMAALDKGFFYQILHLFHIGDGVLELLIEALQHFGGYLERKDIILPSLTAGGTEDCLSDLVHVKRNNACVTFPDRTNHSSSHSL